MNGRGGPVPACFVLVLLFAIGATRPAPALADDLAPALRVLGDSGLLAAIDEATRGMAPGSAEAESRIGQLAFLAGDLARAAEAFGKAETAAGSDVGTAARAALSRGIALSIAAGTPPFQDPGAELTRPLGGPDRAATAAREALERAARADPTLGPLADYYRARTDVGLAFRGDRAPEAENVVVERKTQTDAVRPAEAAMRLALAKLRSEGPKLAASLGDADLLLRLAAGRTLVRAGDDSTGRTLIAAVRAAMPATIRASSGIDELEESTAATSGRSTPWVWFAEADRLFRLPGSGWRIVGRSGATGLLLTVRDGDRELPAEINVSPPSPGLQPVKAPIPVSVSPYVVPNRDLRAQALALVNSIRTTSEAPVDAPRGEDTAPVRFASAALGLVLTLPEGFAPARLGPGAAPRSLLLSAAGGREILVSRVDALPEAGPTRRVGARIVSDLGPETLGTSSGSDAVVLRLPAGIDGDAVVTSLEFLPETNR